MDEELAERRDVPAETHHELAINPSSDPVSQRWADALARMAEAFFDAGAGNNGGDRCTIHVHTTPDTLCADGEGAESALDSGETKMDNLVLLCRHHHRLVHEGGLDVWMTAGKTPKFTDPTGRTIPPVGKTRFSGNVFALRQQNCKNGLEITPETTIPLWEGEKMDDGMAVEGLLRFKQHGQSTGKPDSVLDT